MHAYLIVGEGEGVERKIAVLLQETSAFPLRFELTKIGDVRDLLEFTKLSQPRKTAIIAESIHLASEEAQNALLKSLEEPPQNLLYILTTPREDLVLPTILSRCTLIYTDHQNPEKNSGYEDFLRLPIGERLQAISKIQKREDAVIFLTSIIEDTHNLLVKNPNIAPFLQEAIETLSRIKANGNAHLQLTHLVTSTDTITINR